MSLSRDMARFIVALGPETIPEDVKERAKTCVLNGFGVALAALGSPYHRTAAKAAGMNGGNGTSGATMFGVGAKASVSGAALANGALFHGRCQEDTCGSVHAGAVIIPLLTAMIEAGDYPGDRFLPALVAGYEIAGLLDLPYGVITAPVGLRASILYGTLGAAAAAGRLMGLDEDRMQAALANAASFSGGTLQSFVDGSDEWRYQVGVAAQLGLMAAQLAAAGSVSAEHAFEGDAGFVRAFVRTDCDVDALRARLGKEWSIQRVTFKPYPVCAFNQTPVEAGLTLREKIAGRAISSVIVRMNPYETSYPGMVETEQLTSVSSTVMSAPFCVAATLLYGVPDMTRLSTFGDPAIEDLVARTEVVTDPDVSNLSVVIEVTLDDDTVLTEALRPSASDNALGRAEVSKLVRRITGQEGIPDQAVERLEAFADRFPDVEIAELREIFALARGTAPATTETA